MGVLSSLVKVFTGTRKTPQIPQESTEAAGNISDIADRFQSIGEGLYRDYQNDRGGLRNSFDTFRGRQDTLAPGAFREYTHLQNVAPGWRNAEQRSLRDALSAGSAGATARRRGIARSDSYAGINSQIDAQRVRQASRGLGTNTGSISNMARFGHLAGAAGNMAGEQERAYGHRLRQQLLPYANQMRANRYQAGDYYSNLAGSQAASYGTQGQTTGAYLNPLFQSLGAASSGYGAAQTAGLTNWRAGTLRHQLENQRKEGIGQGLEDIGKEIAGAFED